MQPQLSQRLLTIAHLVSPNSFCIDIGTDHALLPIYLLKTQNISIAYAVDKNKKPLQQAQKNIDQFLLSQKCLVYQSNGFCHLTYTIPATICMAGMGGHTIQNILEGRGTDQEHPIRELILQPNDNIAMLRKYLWGQNWRLVTETIIKENHRFFITMKWIPQPKEVLPQQYSPEDVSLGLLLRQTKSDIFLEWLHQEKQRLLDIQRKAGIHFLKEQQDYLQHIINEI